MAYVTPRKASKHIYDRNDLSPSINQQARSPRPLSEATDLVETDIEDDSSVFEEDCENSAHSSCASVRIVHDLDASSMSNHLIDQQ